MYTYDDRGDGQRKQRRSELKVWSGSTSPNGKCVVVLGQYFWGSSYEGRAFHSPAVFSKRICECECE